MRPSLGVTSVKVAVVLAAFALAVPAFSTPFTIVATFDSSITSDPNHVAIEGSINAAISQLEGLFTDPITVPILFQEESGGLGESSTPIFQMAYTDYRADLIADAKTSNDATAVADDLPNQASSPVDGATNMWVTVANGQALGLNTGQPSDGTISLNTSIMNFDRNPNDINPNFYDAQSVVLHEIDEVLGMGSGLNLPLNFPRLSRPQDLFRYTAPGVLGFSTGAAATAYFSIDGGTTDLVDFNQIGGGSDYGDWKSVSGSPKVQDAFGTPGSVPVYGVEAVDLDVIGYDLVTPEPGTWLLLAAGIGLVVLKGQRSASRAA